MPATETFVTMPDGIRLFTRTVDAPSAAPDRPTLLIPNGVIYLDDFAPLARTHRHGIEDVVEHEVALVQRIARPGELDRAALVLLGQLHHPWLARCPRASRCPVAAHLVNLPTRLARFPSTSPAPPEPSRRPRVRRRPRQDPE